MSFYSIWQECIDNNLTDESFCHSFVTNTDSVKRITLEGNNQELSELMDTLDSVEFDSVLSCAVEYGNHVCITPADVPCYSNLQNGIYRLNEILEFYPEGLSFIDIGYKLVQSEKKGAREKYGENHSKLAAMAGIVQITHTGRNIVKNTAIGSYLSSLDTLDRNKTIRLLLLQNKFVQFYLSEIENNHFKYRQSVRCLSDSTAKRRRANVRNLIEFITNGSYLHHKLRYIDWQV